MIALRDVRRLIEKDTGGAAVLTLYLDMSVNSENKRTWGVFLAQQRAGFAELASDNGRREPVGAVLAQVERWLDEEFRPENRGVAIFATLDGTWFEALQFPVRATNRLVIGERPVVGPLREIVESNRRHAVVLVDRRHMRVITVCMNTIEDELVVEREEYPANHDVQAGGEAAKDHQKRKAEEARQFFREFAAELQAYERRWKPDAWVLLGTHENTTHFREFLPPSISERIVHEAAASVEEPAPGVVARLRDFFEMQALRARAESIDRLRERVRTGHYAVAGIDQALEQLQEGKVETLVIARDLSFSGGQCTQCSFVLARRGGECPYCGGTVRDGIDLAESMVRMATEQEADVAFVESDIMRDLDGVGALLRF